MIVVSACLAGVECRYDGRAYTVPAVVELVKNGHALPLCPEVLAGLPTPRPSVEILAGRLITSEGEDMTLAYETGALAAAEIAKIANCKKAILKSKSPTCGVNQIYDGTFSGKLIKGQGIFCRLLLKDGISVVDETTV